MSQLKLASDLKKFPEMVTTRISNQTMKSLQLYADKQRWSLGATVRIILEDYFGKRGKNGK